MNIFELNLEFSGRNWFIVEKSFSKFIVYFRNNFDKFTPLFCNQRLQILWDISCFNLLTEIVSECYKQTINKKILLGYLKLRKQEYWSTHLIRESNTLSVPQDPQDPENFLLIQWEIVQLHCDGVAYAVPRRYQYIRNH